MQNLYDVIIVGGGPAGLAAALYLGRARCRTLVIEEDTLGGQIKTTEEIVNYPGVLKASGEELIKTMHEQALNFGAEFLNDEIVSLKLDEDIKEIKTKTQQLKCFGVIIATGATPRVIGFKGESEFKGQGVAYCATCDGEFYQDKEVFVIGGGYVAAEESVFLTKFAEKVTILVREDDFTCPKGVSEKAKNNPKIEVKYNTEVVEVNGTNKITEIQYKNNKTEEITTYNNEEGVGVFIFAGFVPKTSFLKDVITLNNYGYIKTDRDQKTNLDGVYAAGDVVEKKLRQVVTAVSDGAVAATELEHYVEEMRKKTGLKPEIKETKTETVNSKKEELFDAGMKEQLKALFSKFKDKLTLEYKLDDREISSELKTYLSELKELTEKIEISENQNLTGLAPYVRVLKDDKEVGMEFHGVPGGHEFTSFMLSLYNYSNVTPEVDEKELTVISEIKEAREIEIFVTLSCGICPDLVIKTNKISSLNEMIKVKVYDINSFPTLKEKYEIMSVPCLIYKEQKHFGKKTITEIIEIIK